MESPKTAVVISTYHKTLNDNGAEFVKQYRDQNFQSLHILFDNKLNHTLKDLNEVYGNVGLCMYNESDFENHKLNRSVHPSHRWGSHQNPNYFYAHFRMLVFWLYNPHYDYYWFFDDDVTFGGDLKGLLSLYDTETYDFLAIQAFKKEEYENKFPFVPKVNENMGSRGHWLSFAPGPGDQYKTCEKHMGSFFPIVRFSNRALKYLYELNQEDFYGYSEGFVPTTIASNPEYSVASMLDENDNYYIKNNIECELRHKGSTFTWTWI